jgi:predicted phage tail protein
MPIWSAGGITLSQDKETSASYLFNLANVGEGGFAYSGSSLKTRHSVVSVSYFNMDSKEVDFEVVEDSTAVTKLGVITKQVKAFACTSRNQAARLGRAILFAEQNESETITFSTSIDAGIVVRPGSVIEINDPVRAGARRGGRVVAATTTTITIDAVGDTTLSNLNNSVTIAVILPDGTVETGSVSNVVGAVFTVNSVTKSDGTTQSAFSSAPNVNAPYLISSTDLQTQLFRVIQVEEQDDINYVITALSYVEGKYAFIEDGTALPTRTISLLNAPASPPSNLTVSEKIVTLNNMARSKLIVDWQPVDGVTQYLVNYKFEDTNFISQIVFSSDFEILDSKRGTYTIEVYSFNAALNISPNSTEKIFVAEGKTAVPENVQNLTIESINDQFVRLRFKQATAVDVLHGGRVYIRHTNLTGGSATFQAAQDIIEAVPGNSTEAICPALPGTYLAKFQDDGLRFSTTEASVSITLPDIRFYNC